MIRYLIDGEEFKIKRIADDKTRFYNVNGKNYEVHILPRNGHRVFSYNGENGTATERVRVKIYQFNRQEPAFRKEIGETFVSQFDLMPINFRSKLEYFVGEFYKKILSIRQAEQK
ncbi:hypothetical protein HY449_02305 [Candidatus Pacearchaeota archaeon]|nr:hypothetical protein [Candidatus Pacearchaeota archaeon]